ncbi:small ribosomal subunit protein uS11-like [Rhynchophorus ferrugineus]|uniref:small ribosomal subunit protein uS11-like n=1 Tax=Rhynchophorus ferrugineus TaxID=354439 RepID=UPI003FCCC084
MYYKTRVDGRRINRKDMMKSLPKENEAILTAYPINNTEMYPKSSIEEYKINGMLYKTIPIINIKISKNNTILNFSDMNGVPKIIHSSGIEGFKNSKKGTNIAAQCAAITLGVKILERGIKYVKVKISGLGPGRISSVKGLQMAGISILSITDDTKVTFNPQRAKKQRKL